MARALVAYASKHGSTREVAERIASVLGGRGLTVDVTSAAGVRGPLDGYDLVVLGGALYSGRWHSGARRFLRKHRELAGIDTAVFGMGPRQDLEESWQAARTQLDRALRKQAWFHPCAKAVFGGVDPPKRSEHRDLRDWDAIASWAESLAVPGT